VTAVQHNKVSVFNTHHQSIVKCNFMYSNIQFPENKTFTNLLYRWNEIQDLWDSYIHLSQFGVSTILPAVGWRILRLTTWRTAECVQPTCNASSVAVQHNGTKSSRRISPSVLQSRSPKPAMSWI